MNGFRADQRFRDQTITFDNGSVGETIDIPSASPLNYHQAISAPQAMPATMIDGQLFLPADAGRASSSKHACVMIVPGSLGIAPSHVRHAQTLTKLGLAAFVLDPFGPRGITSTVTNQTLYSFAASAYDVLAALRVLAKHPRIDAARIGAQGHSRGGSAVLMAASERLAAPVLGQEPRLRAVLAGYPWSGHQFLNPTVGRTIVHVMMGDRDGWCSPQQVQGHVQAIRLAGGTATMRLFAGAAHSFDRGTGVTNIADAAVSPGAPTAYLADDGAFIHPISGEANTELMDRDLMVYGLKAGYGVKGATLGSNPGEAEAFRADMCAFWQRVMDV